MTVGIAAKCQFEGKEMIIAMSDAQLTAGDIKFETTRSKFIPLTPKVVTLYAGDDATHLTICEGIREKIKQQGLVSVPDVARAYADEFVEFRRRRAERLFLAPYGLTLETFISKQKRMTPQMTGLLADQLRRAELDVEAIITGIDDSGADIFVVRDPGELTNENGVGFAAIGEGGDHAESVFMVEAYSWNWEADRALALAFAAKKRAELASSVGKITYLALVFSDSPSFFGVPLGWNKIYQEQWKKQADEAAEKGLSTLAERAKQYILEVKRMGEDGQAKEESA